MIDLEDNLIFESIITKNNKTKILIFYNPGVLLTCSKSSIIKNEGNCNISDFKKKLEQILSKKMPYIEIVLYKLSSNNINYFKKKNEMIQLSNLTALVYLQKKNFLNDINELQKLDDFKNTAKDCIYTFQNNIDDNENNIDLDSNWYSLQLPKQDQGQSCKQLHLPQEDIFIHYLELLFDQSIIGEPQIVAKTENSFPQSDSLIKELNKRVDKLEKVNENNKKKLEADSSKPDKFSVNFSNAVLLGSSFNVNESLYSQEANLQQLPLLQTLNLEFWIKNKFRIGLGLSGTTFQLNNTLADSLYSLDWNHPKLEGTHKLNVYHKNIKELVSLRANSLQLSFGYSYKFENTNLRLDFDLGLNYTMPFEAKSELSDGDISYRAKINGIDDELMNISTLGLIENDKSILGRTAVTKMSGLGLNLLTNLVYSYNNFNVKFGLGYMYSSFSNTNYSEQNYFSKNIGDYRPTLSAAKSLSANFFMLNLSLGYTFK